MKQFLPPNHTKVPQHFSRLPQGYGVLKIAIASSSESGQYGLDAYEKAKETGREIARQGGIVASVASTGFSLYSAMGAKDVNPFPGYGQYDVTRYQSTHVQGGTIMAPSPDRGVVNPYLQTWQIPNLFVLGASTFPNSGSANPTPTILALTYRTADALVDRYLKKPGMLV